MDHKWPAISRQIKIGFINLLKSIIFIFILSSKFNLIECKGGATRAGAGNAEICVDCTSGNYTEEEMQAALILLAIILCIFFALCSCQCYNRIKYECNDEAYYNKPPTVPVAPYYRDKNTNSNQTNNLTAALMANSGSEIIIPFSSQYNV